jgi:hypothetical protein
LTEHRQRPTTLNTQPTPDPFDARSAGPRCPDCDVGPSGPEAEGEAGGEGGDDGGEHLGPM